jgi:phenylacetate-CoA ligase
MYGYASALYLLASYFKRTHLPAPGELRAVFTTAEPLFSFQRAAIEASFGCRVGSEYGSRDGGLVAQECPEGGLHIFAEGMYVEVVDADSQGLGEIVVTCLDSLVFPIIRYRTGDVGSLDTTPCPCGRSLPKLRTVEGRQTDFLVTPDGRVLHALSVIYILRDMAPIREFKVLQDTLEQVTVQMVSERPLTVAEESNIRTRFATLLGPTVRLNLARLESMPPSPSGKYRYVESRVAGDILNRRATRAS